MTAMKKPEDYARKLLSDSCNHGQWVNTARMCSTCIAEAFATCQLEALEEAAQTASDTALREPGCETCLAVSADKVVEAVRALANAKNKDGG